MDKKQARLARLRQRAEGIVEARIPILHFTKMDVEAVVEELRIHQVELELQLDDIQQSYAALEKAQQRYNKLFDNAPVAYFVIDNDGIVMNANLAASKMLGKERDELKGMLFAEFVVPDFQDVYYFCWRALRSEFQAQSCVIELQASDGTRLPGLLNTDRPEADSNEILLAITNLSRVKESDEAFVRSSDLAKEVNQMRLNILRAIAPEFHRPLGVILSAVELLYKHGKRLTEKKKEQLYKTIRNLIWYLNDIVQDARNIQEIDSHKLLRLEAFDVISFTQQIIDDMEVVSNGRKILFEIGEQEDKTTIIWNLNLYRRIVMNMLGSLMQWTSRAIRCQLDVGETNFSLKIDAQTNNFSEDELDLMFDAFFQGSNTEFMQGRGNGLLLAYQTIETHGGTIRYKSQEGKGIRFIIELPKLQANPSPYRH
jgi:PAS domain S-box-containing protein